jgi:hypothetical protein
MSEAVARRPYSNGKTMVKGVNLFWKGVNLLGVELLLVITPDLPGTDTGIDVDHETLDSSIRTTPTQNGTYMAQWNDSDRVCKQATRIHQTTREFWKTIL